MTLTKKAFGDIITFTRAGATATYVGADGLIKTAAANEPRFDYDPLTLALKGLLIEEARTNLVTNSNMKALAPATYARMAGIGYADVAPDGTLTAVRMVCDGGADPQFARSITVSGGVANKTFACSAWVRLIDAKGLSNPTAKIYTYTTTGVGEVQTAAVPITTTWQRITMVRSFTGSAAGTGLTFRVDPFEQTDGSGNVPPAGAAIAMWGMQVEEAAFATSDIQSTESFTSRSGEARYVDSAGVIQVAGNNVARSAAYGYDDAGTLRPIGLMLEGAGANLFNRSNQFDHSAWSLTDTAIRVGTEPGPDGVLMWSVIQGSAGTANFGRGSVTYAGGPVTGSMYLKRGNHDWVLLYLTATGAGTDGVRAWVNLATGELGTVQLVGTATLGSAKVTPAGNGVYRIAVTGTMPGTTATLYSYGVVANASLTRVSDGVRYACMAQLEAGSVATSYVASVDTFTSRASPASFTGSDGLIQLAGTNVARSAAYGYDSAGTLRPIPLMLEAATTNLLVRSAEFDNASWTRTSSTVTANAETAPDGTATADKFVETATNTVHEINQLEATTGTRTFSIYAKAGERSQISVMLSDVSSATVRARFDLATGAVLAVVGGGSWTGLNASSVYAGNGWWRLSFTGTPGAGTQVRAVLGLYNGADTYLGDGNSGLYIWGAQLESGAFATSYIATTSAQVTRAADVSSSTAGSRSADVFSSTATTRNADVASVNTLSPWYNATEGTLFVEATRSAPVGAAAAYPVVLTDGTNNNAMLIYSSSAQQARAQVNVAGSSVADVGSGNWDVGTVRRAAFAFKTDDFAFCTNGGAVGTDSAGALPVVNSMRIGNRPDLARAWNGHIRRIRYYPRRLAPSELELITSV